MYIRIRKPNLNPSLMPISSAPLLACLAKESDGCINRRFLLRSKYLILRATFQSTGKNSLSKLICLDAATLTELSTWGPCPAAAEVLLAVCMPKLACLSHSLSSN
ncbi:hypothetical protein SAMN00120144_0541 [Hymenobacter roseosalivarius DSM 11622]|uniref:Uncharacterized protein n=1 Tax=Hymenobacter roseosalivarius DSM 11622 TaxID=645990 RepID=A0A1W1VSP4_9BACT|nr:hypothetical protein SAMN00120144_0541 [Hymenobacter roseosalivarius DSM 11622]